jgi:PIN domain nuclease of toxin-antitoxin system
MVILEVELLYEKSRIKLTWRDILTKLEPEIGLTVCDLRFDRIANSAVAEHWTHDPFDRLIVANAKANGLAYLISADEDIRRNYQRAVW